VATRIRYKKEKDLYLGPKFQVFDKLYQPYYNLENIEGGVQDTVTGHIAVKISNVQTVNRLKEKLKKELIIHGVKFENEVRRSKIQQKAIEEALKEKQ